MNSFKVKEWRQKYANTVWEIGLPLDLFRNKTHLKKMISDLRKIEGAEAYTVYDKEDNFLALLFVQPVFLDRRTLVGDLVQTVEQNIYEKDNILEILFEIGASFYQINSTFEQLIMRVPDIRQKVIPGNEKAIFWGNSVYPNKLNTRQFAAADFNELSYTIIKFKEHYVIITVHNNEIIYINSIKPKEVIKDIRLRQSLVRECFLNDQGYFETDRDVIKIDSQVNPIDHDLQVNIIQQFKEYLKGDLFEFNLPYRFTSGTDFQRQVWQVLSEIPYGSVISYEEVAEKIIKDRKKARNYSRAVGSACGKNPIGIIVPCHRVIGKDKSLTGFSGGIALKGALLDLEFISRARR